MQSHDSQESHWNIWDSWDYLGPRVRRARVERAAKRRCDYNVN